MNVLAFNGTNSLFGKLIDNGKKELKRRNLALERVQRARDKCHNDSIK